jgi:hypothetical protein
MSRDFLLVIAAIGFLAVAALVSFGETNQVVIVAPPVVTNPAPSVTAPVVVAISRPRAVAAKPVIAKVETHAAYFTWQLDWMTLASRFRFDRETHYGERFHTATNAVLVEALARDLKVMLPK